jgi:uncharacterized membrane protein YbaN (DUF454 family)
MSKQGEIDRFHACAMGFGNMVRPLYLAAGWLCLGLGFLGIFLPLLPTTPFALLAAFCFSRSSTRLHHWLINQPTFGPIIRDWNQHGVIRPRMKWVSIAMILLMIGYPVLCRPLALSIRLALIVIAGGVIGFIWSRPSQR